MAGQRPSPPGISRRLSERQRAAGASDQGASPAGVLRQFLDKLTEAAEMLDVHGSGAAHHGAELPFSLAGRQGSAVFGYTVRMGLDGLHAERFGDVAAAADRPRTDDTAGNAAPAARAPIVDVFDEDGAIRIVAELPGVAAESVTCTIDGANLLIETRMVPHYRKLIALPAGMDAESLDYSCCNGILEVRLRRNRP